MEDYLSLSIPKNTSKPVFVSEPSSKTYEGSNDLSGRIYILTKTSFVNSNVKFEVLDLKNNETILYDSTLEVASDINISLKVLTSRIKSKSNKPYKKRYIIKTREDNNSLAKNYVLVFNHKGDILTFNSINSARSYFNVKWSVIKKNIDKNRFVNINGVDWKIVSITPMPTS